MMNLLWWLWGILETISVFTVVTAIVTFLIPITRNAISKYLGRYIDYGFDEQLEMLRSELRQAESRFKAELQANESRIRAVTDRALSTITNRQSALETRRLQAVEILWKHKAAYDAGRAIVISLSVMNLNEVSKRVEEEPKIQHVFKMLDEVSPLKKWKKEGVLPNLEENKPFLSPAVWGIYHAYRSIIQIALLRTALFANGIGDIELVKTEDTIKLIKTILPDHESYLDMYGLNAGEHLLEALDKKLLEATKDMLSGEEASTADIEFTNRLMQISSAVSFNTPEDAETVAIQSQIPEDFRANTP